MNVIIPEGFENLQSTGKEAVIQEMVSLLETASKIKQGSTKAVVKAIMDREMIGTTGIMNGVGVPHARCDGVMDLICCVGRSAQGVDFESLDSQPTYILFLLLTPKDMPGEHLVLLAQLSAVLRQEKIIKMLRQAASAAEMIDIMNEA